VSTGEQSGLDPSLLEEYRQNKERRRSLWASYRVAGLMENVNSRKVCQDAATSENVNGPTRNRMNSESRGRVLFGANGRRRSEARVGGLTLGAGRKFTQHEFLDHAAYFALSGAEQKAPEHQGSPTV